MKRHLPPRVFEKSGTYWRVTANGDKRIWTKLCRVKDGLPAMYMALAKLSAEKTLDDMVPKLVGQWWEEIGNGRGAKQQENDRYMTREIADAFVEFRANQVKTTDVVDFLKQFKAMPRTFNGYRSTVRELMRFAEEKGFREPESNPCAAIKTMKVRPRTRYITDSELRRIKVGAAYGKDGLRTRSWHAICCMIDMAYLTGQRIGDLLTLEWSAMQKGGIYFEPGKVENTTAVKILIQWTPKLRAAVERLKNPPPVPGVKGNAKPVSVRWVFSTLTGKPYTYAAIKSAWARARERSGLVNIHFHDLRAKALTDKDGAEGIGSARTMGGHSTEHQTSEYVRHKTARKTGATR